MRTTETLAQFIATCDSTRIPPAVRHEAARCLVNWAACALGGAGHPAVESALAALGPFVGAPQANLIGRGERVDALNAALFNGISSHVLDFDDTHMATLVHPSGPVISALLALAQYRPIDGRAFAEAIAIGIDVECRVAAAVSPQHYDQGWHITGTAGGFGAAAAAGRALNLDPQRMTHALGIAATQAAGLREMFGSMCKSLHPGKAAQNGLGAALMAAAGFTSSTSSIEGARGFAHVMCSEPHLAEATEGLAEHWHILDNSYKPYACGLVIHPVIDACLALHRQEGFAVQAVEQVQVQAHPLVLELTGKKTPGNGLEGKFSVFHSAAVALLKGVVTANDFSDEVVRDPAVIAMRARVGVTTAAGIAEDAAEVSIRLKGGRILKQRIEHALGSTNCPMSDKDIEGKFRDLAEGVLSADRVARALDMCWQVSALADAGTIGEALAT
ncbi:MAG TPA: MmgE/PrpD family protein [Burkholderiales bacterium]|nr:MmgE/PrpD family protein [Burkholderiales bacterium]